MHYNGHMMTRREKLQAQKAQLGKWLRPGIYVKRWLIMLFLGILFLSLGFGYEMVHVYRTAAFPPEVYYVTLQFIDRFWRGLLFIGAGVVLMGVSVWQLSRSVIIPLLPTDKGDLSDILYRYREQERGPRIVTLGGGTGLSSLLRGLKQYSSNLTAIVTVADDGGSSGRLRRDLKVLPPGDFRQCIAAMAEAEPLMTELFSYRFSEAGDLSGHSFGNLFIAAMTRITGNFERALKESSRVLNVRGQIVPSTLEDVTLCAELDDESTVEGESSIPHGPAPIRRVYLRPDDPPAYPEAVDAIEHADMIVIGPGSLYTSIMPNLLVAGIARAIKASHALKVYVCNVATQPGETDGYALSEHIKALNNHVGAGLFSYVLVNNRFLYYKPEWNQVAVMIDDAVEAMNVTVVTANVVEESLPTRHNSLLLAEALIDLYERRGR
jgi:uncharacterized cofD-like protein